MKQKLYEFKINPVSKPRMTRSDKWATRDCTDKYWAYKDELLIIAYRLKFKMPECRYHLIFWIPMPKSWSKKKRAKMSGQPHQSKPDKDNLEKAFLDALCKEDCKIWDGKVTKYWNSEGRIIVKVEAI